MILVKIDSVVLQVFHLLMLKEIQIYLALLVRVEPHLVSSYQKVMDLQGKLSLEDTMSIILHMMALEKKTSHGHNLLMKVGQFL